MASFYNYHFKRYARKVLMTFLFFCSQGRFTQQMITENIFTSLIYTLANLIYNLFTALFTPSLNKME